MSVFRYYLPGIKPDGVTDAVLAAAGLSVQFADVPAGERGTVEVMANGPDGSSGTLVVPMPRSGEPLKRMGWNRDHQDAMKCGDYWLVTDRDDPPTPTGLERLTLVSGYIHKLGDGAVWECPIITQAAFTPTHLPQVYRFADGEWNAEVAPQYVAVWNQSVLWSVRLLSDYADTTWPQLLGLQGACGAAAKALSVNYRVTAVELSAMQALTTDSVGRVLDSAIDKPFFDDLELKKKESIIALLDGLRSSLDGSEESTPATDPAEPITNSCDADTAANLSTSYQ